HIALPLKYRPMNFSDMVGQEHVVRTLRNAIESGRIANAYLFIGPRGIGKTTTSRILAKALNCTNPKGVEPCGECENCRQIAAGRSIDVTELDAASHNKVEDVKPIMDAVQFKPVASKYKIFIIDECHMLTNAAWNALLKTLEEPPPYVKFIFATTEGDKLLATIISRCQRFDLRRIQTHQIAGRLRHICEQEGITAEEDALLAIARGAEGGMRDALSSLDQLISFKGDKITEEDALGVFGLVSRAALEDLSGAILKGDAATILRSVETFDSAGKNMRRLAGELLQHFRNLLVCQTLGANAAGIEATPDQIKTLCEQAKMCDASRIFRVVDQLATMEDKLRYVLSVRTLIEITLIRASRIATVASIEELMRAVRALRGPVAPAGAAPVPPAAPAPAPAVAAAPAPSVPAPTSVAAPVSTPAPTKEAEAPKHVLTQEEQRKIMDDPKLNSFIGMFKGAQITDMS
ncbi:MAG: DNA polymerase III subunit gamma/tau, partial [Kiritimatiellae bacterium]|nr:DNA polymerase III subunit gamma/tau [Kiritimatiellia bacterium]